jgi:lysozyme
MSRVAPSLQGIDVSSNQGSIDWNVVAGSNLSFAFLRATIGAHTADGQFSGNWARIRGTGMIRGAYHFFWPLASASDQADNYIETVGRLMPGDLPPALDIEESYLKANPEQDVWMTIAPDNRLPMILNWLTRVEHAESIKPIIYSRKNYLLSLLGNGLEELASYPLWIAHYTTDPQPEIPSTWRDWAFWQYTDAGRVNGISADTDQNRFGGTLIDLKALTKGNGGR